MPGPIRVLLVGDDPPLQLRLESAAEADGVTVVGSTADGEIAAAMTSARRPDVVLLDLDLRSGGVEATGAIARVVPGAKILLLAGSDSAPDLFPAIRAGAAAYLLRSRPVGEIMVALRPVRDGMHLLNPELAGRILTEFAAMAPNPAGPALVPQLTGRERTVLALMAEARSIAEIGGQLSVSTNTVRAHIRNVVDKLHLYVRMSPG